jgi:hypothetical protein
MSETALEFRIVGLGEALDDGLPVNSGFDDSVGDPVAKFFARVQDPQLAKFTDGDWNEQLGAPLSKAASTDTDPRKLWKSIVRTERVMDQDGDVWANGYDSAGKLVDARLLIGTK